MIIKNCPAYDNMPNMYDEIYGWCKYEHDLDLNKCLCENITDCLLKKIVEKCRKAQEIMDKEEYYEDDFDTFNGESIMAERIMDMLEIEECE